MTSNPKNHAGSTVVSRRDFLQSSISGGVAAAVFVTLGPPPAEFELDEATIDDLSRGMRDGHYTSREIVEKYLARIDSIDKNGPTLKSVIELNPEALAIADALDTERKKKGSRGPMHGVPVLIKDNIDTADRMMTTAGSLALVGVHPPADAFLAQQLRKAGAIVLGKTNLSEWANIRSTRSTSGWSGRGGLTKNPYALDRNTSGSSSGSAVAVAANLCVAAVGTETDGSIVSPSSLNGIVGIKPTVGLISRTGVIPISHTQDTAGPMARTVRDAAILLGALVGVDTEDAATQDEQRREYKDYAEFLDPRGLRGARIGVIRKYFGFHPGVDDVMASALETMKQKGAVLVDPVEIDAIGKLDDIEMTILMYELKAGMNAYLARRGSTAPVHTLKEIIQFNERHVKTEMQFFGQELFLKAEGKGPLTTQEYLDALQKARRMAREEGIHAAMDKHQLDALVAPTDGPAWLTDVICGDHFIGGSSNLAAVAGCPSMTIPAGYVYGLPIGISFFGRAWSEPSLIRLAYGFEQATKVRKKPAFLATAEVR